TFNYTVSDGVSPNDISSSSLTVTITGANDAPVAANDIATATEDVAGTSPAVFNVLNNDGDVDVGDTKEVLTFTYAGQLKNAGETAMAGNGATLSIAADGTVTFTQNGAFNNLGAGAINAQFFTYKMQDGAGAQSIATGQINITGVNDAPVANDNGSPTPIA